MKCIRNLTILIFTIALSGCSVFGQESVEVAPYKVLEKSEPYELRHYESMVLITASMGGLDDQKSPFYKLFGYISGDNKQEKEIPMTAPVFMDQSDTVMETMSFVLPKEYDFKSSPIPTDKSIKLEEVINYTVATITFNGTLRQDNIQKHTSLLEQWIKEKNYQVIGSKKVAGYNPPFTIPMLRRNEVLIPVEKPKK